MGQLETIQMFPGEDPELFLERVYKLINTMQVVGIEKSEWEIVQINVRQLSDDYDAEERFFLSLSDITRAFVEHINRTPYVNGKVKELKKPQVPTAAAAARDPYALTVGGFRQSRGGGSDGQRRGGGGYLGGGAGQQ